MEPDKIKQELEKLWNKYQELLKKPNWENINEARAILYLTAEIYCEQIATKAIERRLHLLKLTLTEFFHIIDKKSEKLNKLRKNELFNKLEKFYKIIKQYKNKYTKGKYYLDEEEFIEKYNKINKDKSIKIGYKGSF